LVLQERALVWAHEMLVAPSLGAFAAVAAHAPAAPGEDPVVSLVLADPGHELRQLMFGIDEAAVPAAGPVFVDSLVGVAPQCAALHVPWCGEYRVADHALLLPGVAGLRQLVMLPLQRGTQLIGVFCVASRAASPALATLEPFWLAHVAAVVAATLERLFDRARLLRAGMTDPLTGWNSRRFMQARLREEVARSLRFGAEATCLVIDVDRLQRVNERFGQQAGDRALREIVLRIESQVRSSDSTAHLGSDQFAVLLPATSAALAVPVAERIQSAIRAAPIELAPGVTQAMSVSIGIASGAVAAAGDGKAAADQWLAEAEGALHRAKRRGGDCYEFSFAVATSMPGRSARPRPQ
jgi:diguanylate cyclase (GGDEF)-like protein